jgi:hypothetical protein
MNKALKKRVKEAVEKVNQEKAKLHNSQNLPSSSPPTQRRGFTPKPEKKRG